MPVLLPPELIDAWLSGEGGNERLVPASAGFPHAWPVSRRVNSSRAPRDASTLMDPIPVPGAAA